MSKICAKHYIDEEILNLPDKDKSSVQDAIENATTAAGVIDALKDAFDKVLKGTNMDSETFFKPVRDLTVGSA